MSLERSTIETKWLQLRHTFKTDDRIDDTFGKCIDYSSHDLKRLIFKISIEEEASKDSWHKLTMSCTSEMSSIESTCSGKHFHYLVCDRSSVKICIEGRNGKRMMKWAHLHSLTVNPSYYISSPLAQSTLEDACFISKDDFSSLRSEENRRLPLELSVGIEVYGRLQIICCCNSYCCYGNTNGKIIGAQISLSRKTPRLALLPGLAEYCGRSHFSTDLSDADVKFELESESDLGQTIAAHSSILTGKSPVLDKMLNGVEMVEKNSGVIQVKDVTCATMKYFLQLVYCIDDTDELVKLPAREVLEVLSVAHKYQVNDVEEMCVVVVMSYENTDLSISDAYEIWRAGNLYDIPGFATRAFQWMKWYNPLDLHMYISEKRIGRRTPGSSEFPEGGRPKLFRGVLGFLARGRLIVQMKDLHANVL